MEVKFTTSMSCGHCKTAIIKALKRTRGVKAAEADIITKTVTVCYNENETNADKLKKVIESEGYDAEYADAN